MFLCIYNHSDLFPDGLLKLLIVNHGRDDVSHIAVDLGLFQIRPERASVAGLAVCVLAVVIIPGLIVFTVSFGDIAI